LPTSIFRCQIYKNHLGVKNCSDTCMYIGTNFTLKVPIFGSLNIA
jgi:hypothetical protein